MSEKFDYGPLCSYEITWKSGHIETVKAHQVTYSGGVHDLFRPGGSEGAPRPVRIHMHGEINGRWRLVLTALEDDIVSIRDVTVPEQAGGAS